MTGVDKTISVDEAFHIVDERLADVRLQAETVPARQAIGRVLRADAVSRVDLPPFDKSAMDGYAVLPDDQRDEYRLLETVPAGHVPTLPLVPGATTKVMTGSAVPAGAGRVIIVEHTEEHGDLVRVNRHDSATNICKKGEDICQGDVVLKAGGRLSAIEIANLIACGIMEVEVARRARIAIISTGDEIVDSPELLAPGKIMNSNGPMLAELAKQYGQEVVSEESVPDDQNRTISAIRAAVKGADVVALSGGVSVGDFDFVLSAMSDVGLRVHFSRLAAKPGKPTVFATVGQTAVFGLPGNPVSVYVMFHIFVLRAIAFMSGSSPLKRELLLRLGSDFARRKKDRTEYVPCKITERGAVERVEFHGSAHLAALINADGFFIVPSGVFELRAGDEVSFVPIGGGLR